MICSTLSCDFRPGLRGKVHGFGSGILFLVRKGERAALLNTSATLKIMFCLLQLARFCLAVSNQLAESAFKYNLIACRPEIYLPSWAPTSVAQLDTTSFRIAETQMNC